MKIVTYEYDQDVQVGVISDDGKFVYPANKYSNMYELIQKSDYEELLSINRMALGGVPLDQVKILAPLTHPRNDIICLGINYKSHDEELPDDYVPEKSCSGRSLYTSPNGWTGLRIRMASSTVISM